MPFNGTAVLVNASVGGPTLRLDLDMRLPPPNECRGWHWSKKNRTRKDIELSIEWALLRSRVMRNTRRRKRTVRIIRVVDSKRKLIKDEADNLPFAGKPVYDALVNLGLLHDDRPEWLTGSVTQRVETHDHTIIEVEPFLP